MDFIKYKPVIYKDGSFYKVKPYVLNVVNNTCQPIAHKSFICNISTGEVTAGFITSDNYTFLTSSGDSFITAN